MKLVDDITRVPLEQRIRCDGETLPNSAYTLKEIFKESSTAALLITVVVLFFAILVAVTTQPTPKAQARSLSEKQICERVAKYHTEVKGGSQEQLAAKCAHYGVNL